MLDREIEQPLASSFHVYDKKYLFSRHQHICEYYRSVRPIFGKEYRSRPVFGGKSLCWPFLANDVGGDFPHTTTKVVLLFVVEMLIFLL